MHTKKTGETYVIRLDRGERVIESITKFAKEKGIQSAFFQAIGGVDNAEIGYYDLKQQKYFFRVYEDELELVSMNGNIAMTDGAPLVHAHAVVADTQGVCTGGHVKEMRISISFEMVLQPFRDEIDRMHDKETGLKLLQL